MKAAQTWPPQSGYESTEVRSAWGVGGSLTWVHLASPMQKSVFSLWSQHATGICWLSLSLSHRRLPAPDGALFFTDKYSSFTR